MKKYLMSMVVVFIAFHFVNEYFVNKNVITYTRIEPEIINIAPEIKKEAVKKVIVAKNDPLKNAKEYEEPNIELYNKVAVAATKHEVSAKSMKAVLWCESNYKKTAKNHNNNGSTDGGIAQINSIHKKELKKLGLDINNIDHALEFMAILIKRNGMRDYKSSEQCWTYVLKNF
jgi:hypothetical protein